MNQQGKDNLPEKFYWRGCINEKMFTLVSTRKCKLKIQRDTISQLLGLKLKGWAISNVDKGAEQ